MSIKQLAGLASQNIVANNSVKGLYKESKVLRFYLCYYLNVNNQRT